MPSDFAAEETLAEPVSKRSSAANPRMEWYGAARVILTAAIFGASVYTLSNYVRALIWALVLAVALWPLFRRTAVRVTPKLRKEVLPALFTLVVALVFVLPFAIFTLAAARDAHALFDYGREAEKNGIPVPDVISQLPPNVAKPVSDWWNDHLARSGWAKELGDRFDTASNREMGRNIGRSAIHRIVLLGFALLALFFLFRDGEVVQRQCLIASTRILGPRGERIGRQVVASIRGTVNGLVLVGLGEGVILGVVYFFTGVPHAILVGALTAVAAMVPFAAAVAFCLAALFVLAAGKAVSAIVIVVTGFLTTFTADHFFRPSLIGGTTKLPFIWVLLGILGGVETFGLLGLFVGPALMAASIMLWRELADDGHQKV